MTKNLKPFFNLLITISAVLFGAYLVFWIEKSKPSDFGFYKNIFSTEDVIVNSNNIPLRKQTRLSDEELRIAKIAWIYFINNYNEETGLVNASDKYPAGTLWDYTSSFLGTISAYEIGIIDSLEFEERMNKGLQSFSKIQLYNNKIPNKVYNANTLKMVDYSNNETKVGLGWTATDIGRFFSFVNKVKKSYSKFTPLLDSVIVRWDLSELCKDGYLQGVFYTSKDKRPQIRQEGRLGYEEYASKGLLMSGYDLVNAISYSNFITFKNIYGINIPLDTRTSESLPTYNFVVSEPYILDGVEYGWYDDASEIAWRIFKVQKERYLDLNIITAVSEDHIDTFPYFVYNTIVNDNSEWKCISESGGPADSFKSISTKAAIGWYVLIQDSYSEILFNCVKNLYDPKRGFYSGRYESSKKINRSITANTNGIILECLNYKMNGPILKPTPKFQNF